MKACFYRCAKRVSIAVISTIIHFEWSRQEWVILPMCLDVHNCNMLLKYGKNKETSMNNLKIALLVVSALFLIAGCGTSTTAAIEGLDVAAKVKVI